MKEYKTFFFHLDSMIVTGNLTFPYISEVIKLLKQQSKKVYFFTNQLDCSTTIKKELELIGIKTALNQIITPMHAIQDYFSDRSKIVSLFIAGSDLIKDEMRKKGSHILASAGEKTKGEVYVILSLTSTLEIQELQDAFSLLQRGAKLILLNPDLNGPNQNKMESGSIARVFIGEQPINRLKINVTGKPSIWMQQVLLKKIHNQSGHAVMVSHSLASNVAIGQALGMDTILITDGQTQEEVINIKQKPTYTFTNLEELTNELKGKQMVQDQ
ncbi:HAD hydrolase-like protein [Alkalihalobacterium chitinilyticum]|uniref:HAD hydrolase-like protein n=1 Tax=Alkalihalobacterium chitinilyticum TaxID=2980103 RepID=A0ABT5VJJ8_9BACI|nr:HAD hydrolase-like protein [Alkalihalobacterium chitinilyticum]MDE5414897.1 HAD hydrolase-like protein [Alkalihalobacterium chitinilyticum]